jgi:hypothetical protein
MKRSSSRRTAWRIWDSSGSAAAHTSRGGAVAHERDRAAGRGAAARAADGGAMESLGAARAYAQVRRSSAHLLAKRQCLLNGRLDPC